MSFFLHMNNLFFSKFFHSVQLSFLFFTDAKIEYPTKLNRIPLSISDDNKCLSYDFDEDIIIKDVKFFYKHIGDSVCLYNYLTKERKGLFTYMASLPDQNFLEDLLNYSKNSEINDESQNIESALKTLFKENHNEIDHLLKSVIRRTKNSDFKTLKFNKTNFDQLISHVKFFQNEIIYTGIAWEEVIEDIINIVESRVDHNKYFYYQRVSPIPSLELINDLTYEFKDNIISMKTKSCFINENPFTLFIETNKGYYVSEKCFLDDKDFKFKVIEDTPLIDDIQSYLNKPSSIGSVFKEKTKIEIPYLK